MRRFAGATRMPVICKNDMRALKQLDSRTRALQGIRGNDKVGGFVQLCQIKQGHQIRETYEHHEKFNKAMRSLRQYKAKPALLSRSVESLSL